MDIEKGQDKFEDLLNKIALEVQEFHQETGLFPQIKIAGVDVTTHSSKRCEYRFVASGEIAIHGRSSVT